MILEWKNTMKSISNFENFFFTWWGDCKIFNLNANRKSLNLCTSIIRAKIFPFLVNYLDFWPAIAKYRFENSKFRKFKLRFDFHWQFLPKYKKKNCKKKSKLKIHSKLTEITKNWIEIDFLRALKTEWLFQLFWHGPSVWQYWLWSFKFGDTKLSRFLHKSEQVPKK